jgi:uncharacterized protein (DUF58 family)
MFYPDKGPNKFQFSALAAAAIFNLLKNQRDAFGLTLFSDKIEFHTPNKSTISHQKYLLNELDRRLKFKPEHKKTDIITNLHLIAEQIHKRSLVVLFSDLFQNSTDDKEQEKLFAALQHLKYSKHEVIIFNINERKHELNFDFENRPYHFIDTETREEIKLNPTQLKEIYLNKIQSFKKSFELKCAQFKIEYIDAHLEDGFYPVLNAWLIKKNRMN